MMSMTIYDALEVKKDMYATFPACHVELIAPIGSTDAEPAYSIRFKLYGIPEYQPYAYDEIVSADWRWKTRKREIKAEVDKYAAVKVGVA